MDKVNLVMEKDNFVRFGKRLRESRKSSKMTQVELASKVGLHQVQIADYEKGTRKPNETNMTKLAQVLGVDPMWLALGEGESGMEITAYGSHVNLKHVNCKPVSVSLSSFYSDLNDEDRLLVNELITLIYETRNQKNSKTSSGIEKGKSK
ncbi:MAG: helix-turn-helix transcriptional regulator [Erysipelotrichaceae bacterium]|nr:helix-turn-helix transcriptional regulator [Erysipelotrichaceae bacterium]